MTIKRVHHYDLYTLVSVTAQFTRLDNGQPIDPLIVTCYVEEPDHALTAYTFPGDGTVQQTSPGNYLVQIDASISGTWFYKWTGSYPAEIGSKDGEFVVDQSELVGSRWPTNVVLLGNSAFSSAA